MEDNRLKFLLIIAAGIAVISLFFAFQFYTGKQSLLNDYNIMKRDLSERNDALTKKIDSLQQERRQVEEKFSAIQKDLDSISRDRDEWKQKYDVVSREKQELIEKFDSLSKQQIQAPAQIDDAQPGSHLARVLKEKAELEVEIGNLKDMLSQMQAKLTDIDQIKKEADLQVSKLMQEKQDLERQLNYNKDYSEKVIQKLSSDAARESKDREAILVQLNEIKAENTSIRGQLKILTSEKINLEKKLRVIEEDKQDVEAKLINLNQNLETRLEDITTLKQDLNREAGARVEGMTRKADQAKAVELPPIVVSTQPGTQMSVSGGRLISQGQEGKIVSINKENNFVIIDLGENSSLAKGSQLGVYRLEEKIGDIEIVQVRKNISAADIKQVSKPFKIGDIVK